MDGSLKDRVLALSEPEIKLCDLALVDLELVAGGGRTTLRYSVERSGGETVDVADCARVSRALSRAFEAEGEDFIPGRFVIEVSSPGIFRPLRLPEHYERALEQTVKLVAADASGSMQEVRGRLRAVEAGAIEIEMDGGDRRRIEFDAIRRAQLDPELDFGRKKKTGE